MSQGKKTKHESERKNVAKVISLKFKYNPNTLWFLEISTHPESKTQGIQNLLKKNWGP